MATPIKTYEYIKGFLESIMSENEAEQYADVKQVETLIGQGTTTWQAIASRAIHSYVLDIFAPESAAGKLAFQTLKAYRLEELDDLYRSLAPKAGEDSQEYDQILTRFYIRFLQAFLLTADGDKVRAKQILHELVEAGTQFSTIFSQPASSGSAVTLNHLLNALRFGKMIAHKFLFNELFIDEKDYREMLFLTTESYLFSPSPDQATHAEWLLNEWAASCEKLDDESVTLWAFLFAQAGRLLVLCRDPDSVAELPSECKPNSPQYQAWVFGQLAARFAYADARWRSNPTAKLHPLLYFIDSSRASADVEEFYFEQSFEASQLLARLVCEYSPDTDWVEWRETYIGWWQEFGRHYDVTLSDITPTTDLHWAMRIGFAEKLLELSAVHPCAETEDPVRSARDVRSIEQMIEQMQDQLFSLSVREMKHHHDLESSFDKVLDRLPSSQQEVREWLQETLDVVWDKLPVILIDTLVKAEIYFRTGTNTGDAIVWFVKAIEGCRDHCLTNPLIDFMHKHKLAQVMVPTPQGTAHLDETRLRTLSLPRWAFVLEKVAEPVNKGLASLATDDLREFMGGTFGSVPSLELKSLADGFKTIQRRRGGSAHYQVADSRYDNDLQEVRNLVLGMGIPSLVTKIFDVLSPQGDSRTT